MPKEIVENKKINKNELNEDQKNIVNYYDSNLLVSAGAGSGKTRVLIAKLIDIICNKKISVSNLLVTTFTREAGNQMIAKLAKSLSDKILETTDNDLQLYLLDQLELLPQASIGTLHTFCQNLIKKYFYAINIEPTFKILEAKDCEFFKNQVLDDLIEDYTEKNDEDFFLVTSYFKKDRSLIAFKKILVEILDFAKSKSGYLDFFKNSKEKLETQKNNCEILLNNLLIKRKLIIEDVYKELYKDSLYINSDKISKYLLSHIDKLSKINNSNSFKDNYIIFNSLSSPSIPRSNSIKDFETSLYDDLKYFNENIKKKVIKIFGDKKIDIENVNWTSSQNIQDELIEIIEQFDIKYKELKQEKNFFDFNDLEEYTLKILDNEELRKTISEKYKFIFVDEYQDTNEIQENILSKISNGNNMIMVGDVKQSIYGFRNTSPEIFLKKYNLFSDNKNGKVINLNTNYRSQEHILDYCNFLFGKVMTIGTSDIDYQKNHFFNVGNNNGNNVSSVEFHILENNTKKEKIDKLPQYDINTPIEEEREYELDLLVKVLKDTLNKTIYDNEEKDETKKYRKCLEKDICILCRDSKSITEIATKFTELRIPYTATYKIQLYTEEEINLILSILMLIQNSNDNISLATVLTSHCVNITYSELLEIRKMNINEKNFYDMVKNYSLLNNPLSEKINNFYDEIFEFRKLKDILPLKELVEKIIDKYNILHYFSLKKDGEVKTKNIYTFLNSLTNGFYTQNLTTYLNYINGYAINDIFEIEVNGGENSIKIQTIHASKGLEYNVLILYSAGQQFFKLKDNAFLMDKDLGLSLKERNLDENSEIDTLNYLAIKDKISTSNKKENLRLLYVALTRAKNKLIIIGKKSLNEIKPFNDNIKGFKDIHILSINNYLSLMLSALSQSQLDELLSENNLENNKVVIKYHNKQTLLDSYFELNYYKKQNIEVAKQEKEQKFSVLQNNKDLEKIKNFVYFDIEAVNTRLKNTVTALQEEKDETILNFSKNKQDDKSEIDPLTKGNSYHFIMKESNLDFNNLEKLKELPDFKNVVENEISTAINIISKIKENRKIITEKMFLMNIKKSDIVKNSKTNEKILIQGIVDLVLEGEKDLILIDYKTTKGNDQVLKNSYSLQLNLYSKALENFYKKPVIKKYIYSFYQNKLVEL